MNFKTLFQHLSELLSLFSFSAHNKTMSRIFDISFEFREEPRPCVSHHRPHAEPHDRGGLFLNLVLWGGTRSRVTDHYAIKAQGRE